MAPGSPSQRKARETNFTDIGVAGRCVFLPLASFALFHFSISVFIFYCFAFPAKNGLTVYISSRRKTGFMVKDTGQRNAFGMEHMDAFFSPDLPAAPPNMHPGEKAKANGGEKRGEGERVTGVTGDKTISSESMDIVTSKYTHSLTPSPLRFAYDLANIATKRERRTLEIHFISNFLFPSFPTRCSQRCFSTLSLTS